MFTIKNLLFSAALTSTVFMAQSQNDDRKFVNLGPNVNSKAIEINPQVSADGKTLYFIREGHDENQNFQEIWVAEKDGNGNWQPAKRLQKPLNTAEANGVESVSPDGNKLLIQGFYKKGKLHGNGCSVSRKMQDGSWSVPEGIVIDHYTNMDKGKYNNIFMSNDENVIIFSFCPQFDGVDNDLYISFKRGNGTYSQPVLLGAHISMKGFMDFSPFLASDNKTLYFASDRPGGYGATDIYKIERLDETWHKWTKPENLGPKINGPGRDGYYTVDGRGAVAYMVSDKNSIGAADIVMVELDEKSKPKPVVLVKGTIFDAKTKKPIEALVEYHEYPVDSVKGATHTDQMNGKYSITFPYGEKYLITAHAHGYVASFDTLSFKTQGEYLELTKDYYLTPIVKGEKVVLKHVNFQTNSAVLETESFVELDKVASFLIQNPEVKILIGGHTDNAGVAEKNMVLSDNRAKAVMDYLISKGVEAGRLQSKGYGQNDPLVPNDSPENMALNRRVEFTITEE